MTPPPPVDLLSSSGAVHGDNPNTDNGSYSDLWDKFPEVIEKLKRTRSGMKDLHTMFKSHCDAHKEIAKVYSKSKLDSSGMGQFTDAFVKMSEFADTHSNVNASLSQSTQTDLVKELERLRKELSAEIKRAVKEEKKLRADLSSADSAAKSAKEKDKKEKMIYEKLQIQLIKADNLTPSRINKLQKSVHSAERSQKKAEDDYRIAVEKLHETDTAFYSQLRDLMVHLEELDKRLMQNMKMILDKYAQMQQDVANQIIQGTDILQNAFERINVERDIQDFVMINKTNAVPPEPLTFEPYVVALPDEIESQRFSVSISSSPMSHTDSNLSTASSTKSRRDSAAQNAVTASASSLADAISPMSINEDTAVTVTPAPDQPVQQYQDQTENDEGFVASFKTVQALYDYEPTNEQELLIRAGDMISVLQECDDGWWEGELADGTRGFFPSNFVQVIDENIDGIATEIAVATTDDHHVVADAAAVEEGEEQVEMTSALYDYEAQSENELTFKEGDVIFIREKYDDGWWYGYLESGEEGLFPSNYTTGGAM